MVKTAVRVYVHNSLLRTTKERASPLLVTFSKWS